MASWLPVLPEPTNVRALIERMRKMAESTSIGTFAEQTKKLIEPTSFRVFTERTKKLAKPTNFRVFTERTRKLAKPTRLRILTERTNQRLWLLPMENPRNNLFQPPSRTSKNGSSQQYSREYTMGTYCICSNFFVRARFEEKRHLEQDRLRILT